MPPAAGGIEEAESANHSRGRISRPAEQCSIRFGLTAIDVGDAEFLSELGRVPGAAGS